MTSLNAAVAAAPWVFLAFVLVIVVGALVRAHRRRGGRHRVRLQLGGPTAVLEFDGVLSADELVEISRRWRENYAGPGGRLRLATDVRVLPDWPVYSP